MTNSFILLITLFFTNLIWSQGLVEKYPEIQQEKTKVDQNDSLLTLSIENEAFLETMTDGGGELKGFYDKNGNIKKIEVRIYLSNGIQSYDFYLANEQPIVIIDQFKHFVWEEELNEFDYSQSKIGFKGTYIFENNQLIDQISLGHNRFEDDQIDIEETFMKEFESYFKKIREQLIEKRY